MEYKHIIHPFDALYDEHSRILILGSFPSVKSREQKFFYGHPQNRFWKVLSIVLGEKVPETIEEKRKLLLNNHIALWDVIYSCDIKGSSDSSIRNVTPTDLSRVIKGSEISDIYCNGKTSGKLFARYQGEILGRSAITLPSTSPANAAWSVERLTEAWKRIAENLCQELSSEINGLRM